MLLFKKSPVHLILLAASAAKFLLVNIQIGGKLLHNAHPPLLLLARYNARRSYIRVATICDGLAVALDGWADGWLLDIAALALCIGLAGGKSNQSEDAAASICSASGGLADKD